ELIDEQQDAAAAVLGAPAQVQRQLVRLGGELGGQLADALGDVRALRRLIEVARRVVAAVRPPGRAPPGAPRRPRLRSPAAKELVRERVERLRAGAEREHGP